MFIPIGLDQTSVRRLPWVTFSIIAINLVVFLAANAAVHGTEEEIAKRREAATAYWMQHPYLEFPEKMLPGGLSESQREQIRALTEGVRSAARKAPESDDQRREEQQELDGLVRAFQETLDDHPFKAWGLVPAHPRVLAFLTSMFMHSGWLHLLGNMLFFYIAGPFVEDAFGRPLFAALYLASGIVSSLAHVAAFPTSEAPLVGASGAIAGIMGAFLVRFVRAKVRFFYFYFFVIFRTGTVDLPAWIVLPLWFLEQLFFAGLTKESGVAYRAHVGGFAFGFLAAVVIKVLRIEERFVAPRIESAISVTQHPALDDGLELLARGEARAARAAFGKVLASEPGNVDAHLAVWESHCQEGAPNAGVEHMVRAIEEELKAGEVELALSHWREMRNATNGGGPAPLRWRLGTMLEPEDPGAAIEVFRNLAAAPGGGEAAALLAEKAHRRLAAMGAAAAAPRAETAPRAPVPLRPSPHPVPLPVPELVGVAAPFGEVEGAPGVGRGETGSPVFEGALDRLEAPPSAEALGPSVEVCALETVQPDGVMLRDPAGGCELLPFVEVEKIAVAGIAGSERPYLVLDLLLHRLPGERRRVERLVSTQFDPRKILARPDLPPLQAFRELVRTIAEGAHAAVTPATLLVPSAPIPTFASVEDYEREVLAPLA
jgi:membrane associated rhomboid family serine protease